MDELDEERSNAQVLAAAGAAAALFGALALALTKRRGEETAPAYGLAAQPGIAAMPSGKGEVDIQRMVDQVAEVAPEVVAALEQHAPEAARKLRAKLPLVRSLGGGAIVDALEGAPDAGRRARLGLRRAAEDVRHDVEERVEEAADDVSHAVKGLDLSSLTPAQAAAAQAAIAAVGKAEQAFGASDLLAGITKGGGDGVSPLMRDVAQQAAMLALGLWQGGRGRAEDAVHHAEHAAKDARDEVIGLAHSAADRVRHDVSDARHDAEATRERVEDAIGRAEREAEARAEELRVGAEDVLQAARLKVEDDDSRKGGAAFMWLAAILGLVFYALMGEERRRTVARFSEDASVQVREILRDLKGYDDEF